MTSYNVRLTLVVEANSPEEAVSEFAMNLAEYGTLNWIFAVENLETGDLNYVNRGGEDLDEATLRYMQATIEAHKQEWSRRNQASASIDTTVEVGQPDAPADGLEDLAQSLLDDDGRTEN